MMAAQQQSGGHGERATPEAKTPVMGIALWDSALDATAGWACRSDGEPFRISGTQDLSNEVIWVGNMDGMVYLKRGKQLAHLRSSDFLRCSLTAVAGDLGLRIDGANAKSSIKAIAQVTQRVITLMVKAYALKTPDSDIRDDALYDDIRRILPQQPGTTSHTKAALNAAFQNYSQPDWGPWYQDKSVTVSLRYPRLTYAKQIMATLVPDDSWTYIPPSGVASMSIEELLDPRYPTLVEAAVDLGGADPEIAILAAFGSASSRSKRTSLRRWISQPELRWLARFANVQVASALRCKSAMPIPLSMSMPLALTSDPLLEVSLSAGLLAECHWHAIAKPEYQRRERARQPNSWAVWLAAEDRARCFDLALAVHKKGFRPVGYGAGCVRVSVPIDELPTLRQAAEDLGCSHPCFAPDMQRHGIEV